MKLVAEYVGIGHPDRIADAVVADIVSRVIAKDKDGLCALECAVYLNKVYITGRIAAGRNKAVIDEKEIDTSVRTTYVKCGYRGIWHPTNEEIEIIQNLIIEPLSDEEREIRKYSDDQCICTGYAFNSIKSNYHSIAHFVALSLGSALNEYVLENSDIYGTDFKILVNIEKDGEEVSWNKLTINIRHIKGRPYKIMFKDVKKFLENSLKQLFSKNFPNLSSIEETKISFNGAGEFCIGGPLGDNGLSGKKLVIDFYGPDIPIGGGAIYGKDPHKVDVCGSLRARTLAIELVKKYNLYSALVKLSYSPGETTVSSIEAYEIDEFNGYMKINDSLLPNKESFSIENINNNYGLSSIDWFSQIKKGI